MRKYVPLDEPTANAGAVAFCVVGLMENCAHGLDVPIPTRPALLTYKAGVDDPRFDTTNAGFTVPISTENLPHGLEVPIPTRPLWLARVERERIGVLVVEVAKFSAWSTPFWIVMSALLDPKVMLPVASKVVVAVAPKYARYA